MFDQCAKNDCAAALLCRPCGLILMQCLFLLKLSCLVAGKCLRDLRARRNHRPFGIFQGPSSKASGIGALPGLQIGSVGNAASESFSWDAGLKWLQIDGN